MGDLSRETSSVLVNPTDSRMSHSSMKAKATTEAAGGDVRAESVRERDRLFPGGKVPEGRSILTGSGKLIQNGVEFIVHVVSPTSKGPNGLRQIKSCMQEVFKVLDAKSLSSASIPFLGSGAWVVVKQSNANGCVCQNHSKPCIALNPTLH